MHINLSLRPGVFPELRKALSGAPAEKTPRRQPGRDLLSGQTFYYWRKRALEKVAASLNEQRAGQVTVPVTRENSPRGWIGPTYFL